MILLSFIAVRRVVQVCAAVGMLAVLPGAQAAVINFDNLSAPVALSNQYASQGVMFSQIEATGQFVTSVMPGSAPNYATPFYTNQNPGSLWFTDPNDASVAAYTDSVTITLDGYHNVGGWFDGAIIDALDLNNSVIPGQSQTILPSNGTDYGPSTITFTGQVHGLEFTNILNAGRPGIFPFDNVTFGALTDVPEPGTWVVVGLLAAFGRRRVRR
jgi:hypothetical protein